MKVSISVVRRYLAHLTEGLEEEALMSPFSEETGMAEDFTVFTAGVDAMIADARVHDDEPLLKLCLSWLLEDQRRTDDFEIVVRDHEWEWVYTYNGEDMWSLLNFAAERIWPEGVLSGAVGTLEFVSMSEEEWAARRGRSAQGRC